MKVFTNENIKDFTARGIKFKFIHHEGCFKGLYNGVEYKISCVHDHKTNEPLAKWKAVCITYWFAFAADKWYTGSGSKAFGDTPIEAAESLFVELEGQVAVIQYGIPPKENK